MLASGHAALLVDVDFSDLIGYGYNLRVLPWRGSFILHVKVLFW